jgi:hypothetical protein
MPEFEPTPIPPMLTEVAAVRYANLVLAAHSAIARLRQYQADPRHMIDNVDEAISLLENATAPRRPPRRTQLKNEYKLEGRQLKRVRKEVDPLEEIDIPDITVDELRASQVAQPANTPNQEEG